LIGLGVDSYGEVHKDLIGVAQQLGNLELAVVNETGVIGLLLFVGVIVVIAAGAWKYRSDNTVLGLSAMVLVLGLANQATETLELMITWLLVGLLLTALQQASVRTARDTGS
jgi:O-antigen ligase